MNKCKLLHLGYLCAIRGHKYSLGGMTQDEIQAFNRGLYWGNKSL